MTTTHTEPPAGQGSKSADPNGYEARETALPAVRRRRKPRDWGRALAKIVCVALAVVGALPFATALVVRSAWARSWTARETEKMLRAQGIEARYALALRVWPLAIELTDVRVDSSDGGPPLLECARVRVRPKLFALLAGKVAIDQVEADSPRARVVVKEGRVTNLALPQRRGGEPMGPIHAPFTTFALTDASIVLDMDEMHLEVKSLDLDVTAEDDAVAGSTFELAVRAGGATVHRPRAVPNGGIAVDDDSLCSIEGRVRVEPTAVLVRRLEATGMADLDAAPGLSPGCDLPATDKRRLDLALEHLHAALPTGENRPPPFDGHVRLRAPIALAERAAKDVSDIDGWVALDVDVRYGADTIIPDVSGTLEAHDLRLQRYNFAQELHSQLTVRGNIVESPLTTLRLGGGTVTLRDTVVAPLAQGGKLERTTLEAANVDFTVLLRNLGVHPSSYVGWDIRELNAPNVSGTFDPLKLDGDFTAKTYSFGVYDRPAEDRSRQRIFGFSEAQLAAHLGVRPDAIKFMDVRATLPRSRVEGAYVSLGYHDDLRIDVPRVVADLDDLSPIGPVVLHGKVVASSHVGGDFKRPEPEGDIQSIAGFAISDVQFGDIASGHVKVDVAGPGMDVTGVRARRRDSAYEVPTATLRFGGGHGFVVDAVGQSAALGLRDLLSMFALDEDPRYDGIDATFATRADVRVALGGPEDKCGSGYVGVEGKGHLTGVSIYGERFAQGDAEVSLRWYDRVAGISGADVDVRSFVLAKSEPPAGTRAGATGTLLGSASIRRGGALSANVMVEGVPLSRVDALGSYGRQVEGSISGMAHVSGDLDDFHSDAGFVVRTELDVSGTRVREVALPSSHLEVEMSHRFSQQKRSLGTSRCGAPMAPPFDRAAYLTDTSSHGQWRVNGDLLGGTVTLTNVVATRAKAPRLSGRIGLRGVDLGALARVAGAAKGTDPVAEVGGGNAVGGQLWGELIADDIPMDDPAKARVSFFLGETVVSRGAQTLRFLPPAQPLVIANDTLTMPQLQVMLDATQGFHGGFVLSGGVTKLTHDPTLALEAHLEPVDLAVLGRLVPRVDRASGKIEGSLRVLGKASAPTVSGELHAAADEIAVHGLPGALTDVRFDVRAGPSELSAKGSSKFAGGVVTVDAAVPVRGFEVGALDAHVVAHGVRLAPADGISATLDADLDVAYDAKDRARSGRGPGQLEDGPPLSRVTGEVSVASFDYTRPISLTTDLGTRAKRTEVNAYDPSLDFVAFDVRLVSRAPLVIKNNMAEVQLGIDSGAVEVTGTNQRIGLRGALKMLPGGRFHFQSNDFDVRQGLIRFDDPTRVAPNVDVTAQTEYRRYTDTSAGAAGGAAGAAGVGAGVGSSAASVGSTRGGAVWRITMHAYGDADNLRVDMTSEPSLAQEDIVLLLAVGMTRAELDQLQASSIGASIALNYLGAASGADRALKQALPIIDDFRFGSAYSTATGKTEPQLTVGKRLTNDLRASVTAGLSEDRELRSNIEWRLSNRLSVQGSYDNINDVSSSTLGNLGVDLRWRLEFE
jgi:translocation and assembly module TamB